MYQKKRLIAEFEEQSFTQIIFPHASSDWNEYLDEAKDVFINIITQIIKYQKCLVVCYNKESVKKYFTNNDNLYFVEYKTDDTWARDCSALCVEEDNSIKLLDFTFNGWGDKFEALKDNDMNKAIASHYSKELLHVDFILEGGGVDGNGKEIILTTSTCMLNKNRNKSLNSLEITQKLNKEFGATTILYLNHGYLSGDDTDSHVDTLVRFIAERTIMYVTCKDEKDEHYKELKVMEKELYQFSKIYNLTLIELPMTTAIYYEEQRLPATYANFLFVNGAVLVPTYNVKEDEIALDIFRKTFKDRDIVGIDCSTLIKQHGSLHCVTMNFASGVSLIGI